MYQQSLNFVVLTERFAVCRLAADHVVPEWVADQPFASITRTTDELSIICHEHDIPTEVVCERDWRILKICGPLAFDMVGVAARLTSVLAGAGVSVLMISTFDTDYVLVKQADLEGAVLALDQAGFVLAGEMEHS